MVKRPFLIGVAGGVSSGKSSVCSKIIEQLAQLNIEHKKQILIISFDSFYRRLSNEDQAKLLRNGGFIEHNFDHPSSFDDQIAYQTLINMMNGREVKIPLYDNKTYSFKNDDQQITIKPDNVPDVLIIEGILVFYYPRIRDLFNMKLFVDCDADTRLSRRVLRDMREYDRELDHILAYYTKYVKPAFEEFCLPTKKYADVIIPRGAENSVAINLIVQHINDILNNFTYNVTNGYNNHHNSNKQKSDELTDSDDTNASSLNSSLENGHHNSNKQDPISISPNSSINSQQQQQQQQLNNSSASSNNDLPSLVKRQESSQTRPH